MLHHEDGAASRHLFDELGDTVHVFVAHALGGFVEQHQFGVHRQCGGDLQCAFAAIRQVDGGFIGQLFEAHFGQQLTRPAVELVERGFTLPEMVGRTQAALQPQAHVFEQRQVRENGRDLERADDAAPCDLCGLFAGDVLPVEQDGARRGLQEFGQQVEAGGFACAVGADERMDGTPAHCEVDIADRREAFELFGEMVGLEDGLAHCAAAALVCDGSVRITGSIF